MNTYSQLQRYNIIFDRYKLGVTSWRQILPPDLYRLPPKSGGWQLHNTIAGDNKIEP